MFFKLAVPGMIKQKPAVFIRCFLRVYVTFSGKMSTSKNVNVKNQVHLYLSFDVDVI